MSKRFIYGGSFTSFRSSNSVFFDGVDSDLRFVDNAITLTNGGISIWVRPENIGIISRSLFNGTKNAAGPFVFFGINPSGFVVISARTGTGSGTNVYVGTSTVTPLVNGNYYHIAWTKTGITHKLYVNGVEQIINFTVTSNRNYWYGDISTPRRLTFGNFRANVSSNYYQGYMDEFVISPTTWTQAQVTELYNNGCPANLINHSDYANMVTWLRMGEGDTFPTILDNIGSNNATMTNMIAADITTNTPC